MFFVVGDRGGGIAYLLLEEEIQQYFSEKLYLPGQEQFVHIDQYAFQFLCYLVEYETDFQKIGQIESSVLLLLF